MEEMHKFFPVYDFINNRGYGTRKHEAAILQHGVCILHRMSFKLVPELIAERRNRE